jgi:hypothetical protein
MRPGFRLAVLAVLVSVIAGACTPEELVDFSDVMGMPDSTPEGQAAAQAGETLAADKEAQDLAEEGLQERSPEKLAEATQLRPYDYRYSLYSTVLAIADGDRTAERDAAKRATDILKVYQRLTVRQLEIPSQGIEALQLAKDSWSAFFVEYLKALDWGLTIEEGRQPADPDRVERLASAYCRALDTYLEIGTVPYGLIIRADCKA